MPVSLAAVRQRVERLAVSMASADAVSTWTDERLTAELLALLARLDPCQACGYDIGAHALAAASVEALGPVSASILGGLRVCPRCGAPTNMHSQPGQPRATTQD